MAFPPNVDYWANEYGWTQGELDAYLAVDYILIGTYGILVVLGLRNIWVVIFMQQEYKNLPILMFYLYALIAVALRLINLIWFWTGDPLYRLNVELVQQVAKLCVGVVQDWITIELAFRIRHTKGDSDISAAAMKKLHLARGIIFALNALAFSAFSVAVIASAHAEGNRGFAFFGHDCTVYYILGYLFLI